MHSQPIVRVDADLADLIPPYIDNRWNDLRFARQLLGNADFELLARMAHRIRGSAASYGFDALGEISERLEQAAVQADVDLVATQLDAFKAFLQSVQIEYV